MLDSSRVGSSARKIQSRFLPRFPVCFACYTAESFKIIRLTCIWFKFVDTTFHSSQKKPQKHTKTNGHFTTIVKNHCVKLKTARGLELGPNLAKTINFLWAKFGGNRKERNFLRFFRVIVRIRLILSKCSFFLKIFP